MVKFSLLCPSRDRLNLLENLIQSIIDTTSNLEDVELLIAIDSDDLDTAKYFEDKEYPFKVKVFIRDRSDYINRDYYSWLAFFSEGKYLQVIGNDIVFKVKDWDKIICEKIEEYLKDKPDRIACIGIRDNHSKMTENPRFSCFPIVTKEAYKSVGFILHPELKTWGADAAIYELYNGVKRYLMINDCIYIEHISHHTKMTAQDDLSARIEAIFETSVKPRYIIDNLVPGQVEKLKTYTM